VSERFPRSDTFGALGIDGDDYRLRPKARRDLRDQNWVGQGRRIDADLVRASREDRSRILQCANSTAYRERNEQLACRLAYRIEQCRTSLVRRRNVQ
jgi:hypothetical protein